MFRRACFGSAVTAATAACLLSVPATAQTDPAAVAPLLEQAIQPQDVTAYELRRFIASRIPRLTAPGSGQDWTAKARQLRTRLLNEVIFSGWPREWVEAGLKFEDLGYIASGDGYRARKLRYEIVPGFESTAILYEPAEIRGKIPAILDVHGHVGPDGKAIEYKQKRCISQARQGILALSLEWFAFGELGKHENEHWFGAHLDLAGANAVGLFYLEMRRGLDYLYQHPAVDRQRIGMTGLSGGGWRTIVLSALDERVSVAVPVAGYSSYISRLEQLKDVGDIEQNATDMFSFIDYTHLTAMRAPRPTLLIYNAEDNCCFRSGTVKDLIFDGILPFFRMYGAGDRLRWHENLDPGDHNYQLDNRLQAYRFFAKHFGLPAVEAEKPAGPDLKTPEELSAGLPEGNLTILKLARKMAERKAGNPNDSLEHVIRYKPTRVRRPWIFTSTKHKGFETRSYRLELENGLSATAIWLKSLAAPEQAPVTIILNDAGRKAAAEAVSARVNRGEKVLALDLLFTGDLSISKAPGNFAFTQVLSAIGERPLGLEAAQLIAIAEWMKSVFPERALRLETTGMRSEMVALAAAALQPKLFSELVISDAIRSLRYLLDAPVEYRQAPELFCLNLLRTHDVPALARMAAPTKIGWRYCHEPACSVNQ